MLFRRLRGQWLTHAGAVFIVAATIYHGLNEVLIWIVPGQDSYRLLAGPDDVAAFVVWISVSIFLFTCAYLIVLGQVKPAVLTSDPDRDLLRKAFDWRLLLLACVPLIVLTVQGNGYVIRGGQVTTAQLDTSAGLATQFLLPLLVLLSLGLVLRFGMRWFLPAIGFQSIALAITGLRLEVVVAAIIFLYALRRIGSRISPGQWRVALLACVVATVLITSARGSEGRALVVAGHGLDLGYLLAGAVSVGSPAFWSQLSFDAGHRLDGNSFGAMELHSLDSGYQPLGIQPLVNDLAVAVPRFLYPEKVPLTEKEYAETYLQIPLPIIVTGGHEDILPTQLGATIGFGGPWVMLVIAIALGITFALADRWILRALTPYRLIVGIGLMECVLFYERSWDTYPATMRGQVVLLVIVWVLMRIKGAFSRERPLDPVLVRLIAAQSERRSAAARRSG
jgi:hypothetical protein